MGYRHIGNLYKTQAILSHRQCYWLEKIHGTSAHFKCKRDESSEHVTFFAGGESHEVFVAQFDAGAILHAFLDMGIEEIVVYGEAYGGKMQGMRETYGDIPRFVVFDVQENGQWLNVPQAELRARQFDQEFVYYEQIDVSLSAVDAARDHESVQAIRNGRGQNKIMEGVVLRPIVETYDSHGERIMAKHKRDDFSERKTPMKVIDPERLEVITSAQRIADEWVTEMRLDHVLDKIPADSRVIENMRAIVSAMTEDVTREAAGEIVDSKEARQAIGRTTALMFKRRLQASMAEVAA